MVRVLVRVLAFSLVFGLVVLMAAAGADGDGRSRRPVLGVALGNLALVVMALLVAAAVAPVPAGLIAYLGFFPLLRGLRRVTSMRFRAQSSATQEPATAGARPWLAAAREVIVEGGDLLAVCIPLFASRAGSEVAALALAVVVVAPLASAVDGAWVARVRRRVQAGQPWLLVTVGAYVLAEGGALNGLLGF